MNLHMKIPQAIVHRDPKFREKQLCGDNDTKHVSIYVDLKSFIEEEKKNLARINKTRKKEAQAQKHKETAISNLFK